MKTGKPTRLSEKLNAELDTIRQDYAASMASQLESFRTDLSRHCDQRASYNRERYPHLSATEQELADDLALADHGDVLGGDRLDDGRELALDADAGQLGTDGLGPDADRQGGRDLAGAGPDQDTPEDLHAGRQVSDLHQDRGGIR